MPGVQIGKVLCPFGRAARRAHVRLRDLGGEERLLPGPRAPHPRLPGVHRLRPRDDAAGQAVPGRHREALVGRAFDACQVDAQLRANSPGLQRRFRRPGERGARPFRRLPQDRRRHHGRAGPARRHPHPANRQGQRLQRPALAPPSGLERAAYRHFGPLRRARQARRAARGAAGLVKGQAGRARRHRRGASRGRGRDGHRLAAAPSLLGLEPPPLAHRLVVAPLRRRGPRRVAVCYLVALARIMSPKPARSPGPRRPYQ
mmetsp:Transcript_10799/g.35969  ORF Transcript_10799/g.35969 Transcript_10799/m.35969 type:complete len:259 (+) Transcript_10799:1591-2367(+)